MAIVPGYGQAWQTTLDALQQRNGAVQIICASETDPDDTGPIYRTRLIRFDPDTGGLCLEQPKKPWAARHLAKGRAVSILAADGSQRWELLAKVIGTGTQQLNEKMSVTVVELELHRARSAQRRDYYRVPVEDEQIEPVVFAVNAAQPNDTAKPESCFVGRLVNIGAKGIGVEVSLEETQRVGAIDRVLCTLRLPGYDQPMSIPACVVRRESIPDAGHEYLGLRFEFENLPERQQYENVICRFSAQVQREQLNKFRHRAS